MHLLSRITVLLLCAACAVPTAHARLGDLSLFATIPPDPDIVVDPSTPAVFSSDGRFLFVASTGDASREQFITSVSIDPGSTRFTSRLFTNPQRVHQLALDRAGRRLAAVAIGESGGADTLLIINVNPLNGSLAVAGTVALGNMVDPENRPVFNAGGDFVYVGDASFPGRLFVCDADPTGGIDPNPIQTITLGSQIQAFRLDVSTAGTTLVAAAADLNATGIDRLITYDLNEADGMLTERGRFEPIQDYGWARETNPEVNGAGTVAFVINRSSRTTDALDITRLGTYTAISGIAGAPASPSTLVLAEDENVIAAMGEDSVVLNRAFDVVPYLQIITIFSPSPDPFTADQNVVLNASATLGAVADSNRIYTFTPSVSLASFELPGLSSTASLPNTTSIAFGRDAHLLAVLAGGPSSTTPRGAIFEVDTIDPTLFRRQAFQRPGEILDLTNRVAAGPSGNVVHATTGGTTITIDALAEGAQDTPLFAGDPTGGGDIAVSENGQTIAASDANAVFVNRPPTQSRGSFTVPGADFTDTRMAISADGTRIYVPDRGNNQIHVLDATLATVGSIQTVSPMGTDPTWAQLSPDGSVLAVTMALSDDIAIYSPLPSDGTLVSERIYDPLRNIDEFNAVAFTADSQRALLGTRDGNILIFDTPTAGATLNTGMLFGGAFAGVFRVPNLNRIVAVNDMTGRVYVYAYSDFNFIEEIGNLRGLTLDPSSRVTVLPSGLLALVPNAVTGGGLHLLEIPRIGERTLSMDADLFGATSQTSTDAIGFTAASLDTENNRVVIHRVSQLARPRLVSAILFENTGTVDGVGEAGDLVLLTFDRPLASANAVIGAGDLFLQGGGSLGLGATFQTLPGEVSLAVVTLGVGTAGIIAPGGSLGFDIGADPSQTLARSFGDEIPAVDLGASGFDDSGVDLRVSLGEQTIPINAALGGIVSVPLGDDFAFTGHELQIPPGSLDFDSDITMGPPGIATEFLTLPNVVRIESTTIPQGPLFRPPALLRMEFVPALVNEQAGQLPHLVRVFQIVLVGGIPTPVLVPGPTSVDVSAATVSVPLATLNPAGLPSPTRTGAESGTVGIFATLPVNPVEERSMNIAPASAAVASGEPGPATVTIIGGAAGAYTEHQIEIPGYVETTDTDPNRVEITIRTAALFERNSFSGGQSFPTQSGAIFTVETAQADGTPVSFTDPANVTVQFIERDSDAETDTITFDGTRGDGSQMRMCRDAEDGSGVDFQLIGGTRAGSTVILSSVSPLTDSGGLGKFGSVIDDFAPVEALTAANILEHLVGSADLVGPDLSDADLNSDGEVDIADLVTFILSP